MSEPQRNGLAGGGPRVFISQTETAAPLEPFVIGPMSKHDEINAAVSFAKTHESERGHLPIIMDIPVYRFFGSEWVKIVEVNLFDKVENAEVTIEDGWGERKQVDFRELSLWER